MGVITVTDIDYGQIFGPFPSYLISTDPSYIIGLLTNDKQPEGVVLKVDTSEKKDKPRAVDWLPYVSSARDEDEQNMEAYLKERCIFYRTLRIVKAQEELLVWYSKDFSQILRVPELQTNSKRDGEQFICTHCGEMFDFPFPLRAHLKFKCSFTCEEGILQIQLSSMHSPPILPSSHVQKYLQGYEMNGKLHFNHQADEMSDNNNKNSNNNTLFHSGSRKRPLNDSNVESTANKLSAIGERAHKEESIISHSIEKLSKSHIPKRGTSPIHDNGLEMHSENVSAFRKVEKSPNSSERRASSPSPQSSLRPTHSTLASKSLQRLSPTYSGISTASTVGSSHKMIALHQTPSISSRSTSSSEVNEPSTSSIRTEPTSPIKVMSSSIPTTRPNPAMTAPPLMGMYMPRIPMLPQPRTLGIPRPGFLCSPIGTSTGRSIPIPHSAFPDQIPPDLLEMCRATIPTVGPLTESFAANIRKMDIHDTLSKRALFAERHISSLGFLKSTNPMVEKLLHTTNPTVLSSPINALNLSQNWCAKCNATFRMTSDLVYHMRSHHKREFDPMKRKREEKLKCNICNETFRERHHLTRHMSSHA